MGTEKKLCKHCNSEIDKKAVICVHCGAKQKTSETKSLIIIIILFLLFALFVFFGFKSGLIRFEENKDDEIKETIIKEDVLDEDNEKEPEEQKLSEEEYKKLCEEYNYKDVLRSPQEYVGKKIKITLKISSVHEKTLTNRTKYYFAYSNDEYDWWLGDKYGVFDARENQEPKLLEDDIVVVYGEISDPQYTSSKIVQSEEIFCIDMKYVELISE